MVLVTWDDRTLHYDVYIQWCFFFKKVLLLYYYLRVNNDYVVG